MNAIKGIKLMSLVLALHQQVLSEGFNPCTDDTYTVDHIILSVIVTRCTAHHWICKNTLQYFTVQKPNLT